MKKLKVLIARPIFPETIDRLRQHFDVDDNQADIVYSREEFLLRLRNKQGVLTTTMDQIDADLLAACQDLKICANMAVGYDNFDLVAMKKLGIVGTNTPNVRTESTADFGIALVLAAARRITEGERYLREGKWKTWGHDLLAGQDVFGSTIGIIGFGKIGQGIARRAAYGFGMNVLYHNRQRAPESVEQACRATYSAKDDLLKHSDHVVLALPYSPASHHLIGPDELAQMKSTATLINLARGGVVDDRALAIALKNKRIAAAALDVFEGEPSIHAALLDLPNVTLTPHIASSTISTRRAMADLAADNLIGHLMSGRAVTPVSSAFAAPSRHLT
jgi:glyoxylate/hydroxypyruvate/2-ketogluconate reductase